MKSYIYDLDDNVSIVRTDCMHIGARYTVMVKEKLTNTLTHIVSKTEFDTFEEALENAEEQIK